MMRFEGLLDKVKTVGISGHIHPDGDCIGSCMGLYLYLKEKHPEIDTYVFLEEIPDEFNFIEGINEVIGDGVSPVEKFDLFVMLDTGKDRSGKAEVHFDNAEKTVNIDHHISNKGTGDENYIDPEASSASELVCRVLGTGNLNRASAIALYMGIVTDTGVFKYSNTSPGTMKTAGELLAYGFDQSALIDTVFFERTYRQNLIMGKALIESIRFMDDMCIFSCISRRVMEFYMVTRADLDGIVSQLNLTKGVECAVFIYEIESMRYKVSLRSKGKVNVAAIAEIFGGGGHARAAGCTMDGTHHDVINNLSSYIEAALKGTQSEEG